MAPERIKKKKIEDDDDLDELMIEQSKAQVRSDYRRSLGKEFLRRKM